MRVFGANIPIGIGDLIYIRAMFEPVKHEFSEIYLTFHKELISKFHRHPSYSYFLDQIGGLLFNEHPFKINHLSFPYCSLSEMNTSYGLTPHKPELAHILCKGTSLTLEKPYIVINTKIRSLPQHLLEGSIREFWSLLNQLTEKYKIVVLGERVIEMNQEYQVYTEEYIYSLYPHIFNNIPAEHIVDLTVPALGITTPNLDHIQQDCLIMKEATFVINFGIGGGFCMATAVANTIGYRYDDDYIANLVFDGRLYPNATVTKDWPTFMAALRRYL